jgi:hypothetical protein
MSEEQSGQETPITAAVEQEVIAVEPEELSEDDLEVVAGGNGLNNAG